MSSRYNRIPGLMDTMGRKNCAISISLCTQSKNHETVTVPCLNCSKPSGLQLIRGRDFGLCYKQDWCWVAAAELGEIRRLIALVDIELVTLGVRSASYADSSIMATISRSMSAARASTPSSPVAHRRSVGLTVARIVLSPSEKTDMRQGKTADAPILGANASDAAWGLHTS
jgi:hypothetical protein